MLRTIPKHKGTEHLQAEIKTRIKELTDQLGGPKKGAGLAAGRTSPSGTKARPAGGASGPAKRRQVPACTRDSPAPHAVVGPLPFLDEATPLPGMLLHEDVQLQVVDLARRWPRITWSPG